MTIGERVKAIRTSPQISLSLEKFGARLGVQRSAMSKIENGHVALTDQMVYSICREFGVNEEWLRTGEGPQFIEITRAEQIQQMVDDIMRDHPEAFRRRFVTALAGLDDHGWIALEKFIDSITDQEEEDTIKKLHDDLDRQLNDEDGPTEESAASQVG
jgi:transcriptional regulator with XRE-family HTH domain